MSKTFTFQGAEVDHWLKDLTFQATVAADGKIKVTPTAECAEDFKQYDMVMWTCWATVYAEGKYRRMTKKSSRTKKRPRPESIAKRRTPTK